MKSSAKTISTPHHQICIILIIKVNGYLQETLIGVELRIFSLFKLLNSLSSTVHKWITQD